MKSANYIDNGDFEDGVAAWTNSGTITRTEKNSGAGDVRYGGEGSSMELSTTTWNGAPSGYMYQDVTLLTGTSYHLNLVHLGDGLMYSVGYGSTSTKIINWTTAGCSRTNYNQTTNTLSDQYVWRYPFQRYNTNFNKCNALWSVNKRII